MKIGDKLVLWKAEYNKAAYTDQMGQTHTGYVVTEEVHCVVVELKTVPDMWCDKIHIDGGVKVKAPDGREFINNWSSFASDSMAPRFYWHDEKTYDEFVHAIQAYNGMYPYVKDGQKAVPDGATICEEHRQAFYDECFYCKHGVNR